MKPVTLTAAERAAPLPVNYDLSEPSANLRTRALVFAHRMGWISYLWPMRPDEVPPSELSHMIYLRPEAVTPVVSGLVRELYGEGRIVSGLIELQVHEVLPFVFGLAVAHGVGEQAVYREDLIV